MIAILAGLLISQSLPNRVDLRPTYRQYGLTVCRQNGPLCWDYTTVGVLEYELASLTQQSKRLSPGFLAWAADATDREGTGGSNFGRANRGLEKYGIAPLDLGGDPNEKGEGANPNGETLQAAKGFGQIEFHWLRFWNDQVELTPDQMQAIKKEIADGHPVAVGMRWPNKTTFYPNSSMMQVPERTKVFDGHCVALVGYEDDANIPGGGAFLFRNSWGDKWADGGYAWMPYGLLSFCINDAFALRLEPNSSRPADAGQILEAENLAVSDVKGPQPASQDMTMFGDSWGGTHQLFFRPEKSGQSFTVNVPVAQEGRYEVSLVITRAEDYGMFRAKIGKGKQIEIDSEGAGISRSHPISLGTYFLPVGDQPIRFTVVGHGPASSGLNMGLDQILLRPKS